MIPCPKPCVNFVLQYNNELAIEADFDYWQRRQYMRDNLHLPIVSAVIYLAVVLCGQKYMKTRAAFDLKRPLALWSLSLALFSIVGTVRAAIPEMFNVWYKFGLRTTLCVEHDISGAYGFWVWAFILSKWPELFDTVFVVLRKQKLTFLHVFHHSSVLVMTWFTNSYDFSLGPTFLTMNYLIHALMYSYYALKALDVRVPRLLSKCITVLQIAQMWIGLSVSCYAIVEKWNGNTCDTDYRTLTVSASLYGAYLVLFANFFVKSYLSNTKCMQLSSLTRTNLSIVKKLL